MTVHIHREELHADWQDSVMEWAHENAAELKHFTGLPACSGDCNQGRRACDCQPKEAASACTEIGADAGEDFVNADRAFWVYIMAGLAVWAAVITVAVSA